MQLVKKATSIFDRTIHHLFHLAAVLLLLIVLILLMEIFMRTFWARLIIGTIEIAGYCLAFITFLGAAWVLREDGHVKMDLVVSRLRPRTQALLSTINSIIGAVICLAVTWYGVKATWYTFQVNYLAEGELEIPLFYVLLVIPVGSLLLFLQFLKRTYTYLAIWRAKSGRG